VTASFAGLSGGEYNGQIVITGPNNSLTVAVQLSVNTSNVFTFSPPSVTFSVQAGSTASPSQTVAVSGPSTGLAISASTSSGGNWLSATLGQGGATVSANPAGLAAGSYTGTVTLTSPSSTLPASFPVTLVIWNQQPLLTVTPASVTLSVPLPAPSAAQEPTQTLQVTSGGVPLNFTTNAYSGVFTTPASLSVPGQVTVNLGGIVYLGAYESNVSITSGS
jgi:hypothetical protein